LKGILILALGYPQYGRMAAALAQSIRWHSDIPIALAYADGGLPSNTKAFDKLIEIPKEYWYTWHAEYFRPKVWLDKLTPFKETLYLDADIIWLPHKEANINILLEELKDVDFAMPYRSKSSLTADGSDWCDLKELKHKYKFKNETYYNVSSELIWFKKGEIIREARKHYDSLKVTLKYHVGNCVPDELPYSIALMKKEQKPNEFTDWRPVYWENVEKKHPTPGQKLPFFAFSMGGGRTQKHQRRYYESMARLYNKQNPISWIDKAVFAPERTV